jgi:F-type H+-transporting ATPase subunit gamma
LLQEQEKLQLQPQGEPLLQEQEKLQLQSYGERLLQEQEKLQSEFPFDFKYEPTPKEILDALIPQVYVTSVYTKVLDSIASEHGSRMSAMENASKNCKEMIKKLTIKMNKLRQASITTQLIEVVSGAESLNG